MRSTIMRSILMYATNKKISMPQSHAAPSGPVKAPAPVWPISPTFTSSRLFGGAQTLSIEHAGQRYTLRITRENKLILTK